MTETVTTRGYVVARLVEENNTKRCLRIVYYTSAVRYKDGALVWRKTSQSINLYTYNGAKDLLLATGVELRDVADGQLCRPLRTSIDHTPSPVRDPAPPAAPTVAEMSAPDAVSNAREVADLPPAEQQEYGKWADELPPAELPLYDPEDTL